MWDMMSLQFIDDLRNSSLKKESELQGGCLFGRKQVAGHPGQAAQMTLHSCFLCCCSLYAKPELFYFVYFSAVLLTFSHLQANKFPTLDKNDYFFNLTEDPK